MTKRPLPPLTFSYGAVEKALATAYGISDKRRPGGFRSMLSNLQRLGVLGPHSHIGRGAALRYGPDEMHRFVLALEFCEAGIPPATAAAIVDRYWDSELKSIVAAAVRPIGFLPEEPEGKDVVLYLGGVGLRTDSLRGETCPSVPNIAQSSLDALPLDMSRWLAATSNNPTPPRGLIVNLSARMRAFHAALCTENLADERAAIIANCKRKAAE
jgi:hypothetical protein